MMGTNYYLHEAKDKCPTCGQSYQDVEKIHIGKSSLGWTFGLHIHPEKGIDNFDDYILKFLSEGTMIEDEYGKPISLRQMLLIILNRSGWGMHDEQMLEENHAVSGPMGLMRRKIGDYCIGHGSGTYDLCVGPDESW